MGDLEKILSNVSGFEWDKGNITKNREKHGVAHTECEEVFFNLPLVVGNDEPHSIKEDQYFVLGKTDSGRLLFLVLTVRADKIRVISSRDMNRKERRVYEEV